MRNTPMTSARRIVPVLVVALATWLPGCGSREAPVEGASAAYDLVLRGEHRPDSAS